jgi:hypothetical protein
MIVDSMKMCRMPVLRILEEVTLFQACSRDPQVAYLPSIPARKALGGVLKIQTQKT